MPGSCDSLVGSGAGLYSRVSACTWSEHTAGLPGPPTSVLVRHPALWREPPEYQRSGETEGPVSNGVSGECFVSMRVLTKTTVVRADLGEDVLFPHELLSLSVGCWGDHRQNVLAVIRHHTHKEHQILKELCHKPDKEAKHSTLDIRARQPPRLVGVVPSRYLLSFWVMVPYWSFLTVDSKTLLASLAKSKSLTSDRGTDTIAKASLSSFAGHVPIC